MNLLHELDADEDAARVVELLEAEHRLNPSFDAPVILLNGLITNDKFCFIRRSPVKLEWRRRRRAAADPAAIAADYLREERTLSGGDHEAQMASSPSILSDGGCGASVGSGLPTSPDMDGGERAGLRPHASALLSSTRRSEA